MTPGRATCQVCGATVARAPQFGPQAQPPYGPPPLQPMVPAMASPNALGEPMAICPRCGYRGQSVGYFSRGSHVAALVGLTVVTSGAVGVGGIAYYLLRREYRICPRCGDNWGKHGVRGMALVAPGGARIPVHDDAPIPAAGVGRSGGSIALFILAAFLLIGGVAGGEFVPLMMAAMAGAGGFMLHRRDRERREQRREAIIQSLQLPVLKLAAARGGRLTVTQVATEMSWPIARAEKVLNSLEDGFRVLSDVTDDGVIVYDFLELRHQAELNALGSAAPLPPPPPASPPPAARPSDNRLQA
ncbi:MAG TPA: hypothetical protein VFQ39_16280 [Longimicrobium sp.]|nr:hypothetical protein [Longimicrobium sp.]